MSIDSRGRGWWCHIFYGYAAVLMGNNYEEDTLRLRFEVLYLAAQDE